MASSDQPDNVSPDDLDEFNPDRVERDLARHLPSVGIVWKGEVLSTNEEAKRLARLDASDWTVVVADRQSAGRGRYDRPWVSPHGGLYQSLLLYLNAPPSPLTLLPLIAGLALKEAVEYEVTRHGAGAFQGWLKWPNDLMTPRGKLAGILVEATQQRGRWELVVGAGLNIRQPDLKAEGVVDDRQVTSLEQEHPAVPWTREDLLTAYLVRFKHWLDVWARNPDQIREAWLDASGVEGRQVEATVSGTKISGIARGISRMGALLVETGDGTREVNAAEALIVHEPTKY